MKAKPFKRWGGILLALSALLLQLPAQTRTDTIRFEVEPSSDYYGSDDIEFRFSEKVRDGIKIEWISNNTTETLIPDNNGECTKEITAKAQVRIYYTYEQTGSFTMAAKVRYSGTADVAVSYWKYQLTSLDVSGCKALTRLYCSGNQLTELNVNGCTALETLFCENNQLTSLDVSGCSVLKELTLTVDTLKIHGESMDELTLSHHNIGLMDASGCTSLQKIGFVWSYRTDENDIRIPTNAYTIDRLNVNGCTALTTLFCNYNKLNSLDIGGCTALEVIQCVGNELTNLDMSGCTALTKLECDGNQLTSLDVSNNTALTWLGCGSNQLTSLDVSKNTALYHLDCYSNQLTSLDVSKNTALCDLDCRCNQLTDLDVSQNMDLGGLDCIENHIPLSTLYKAYSLRTYRYFLAEGQSDTIMLLVGTDLDLSSERIIGQAISSYKVFDSYDQEVPADEFYTENGFVFRFKEKLNYRLELQNPAVGGTTFTWHISVVDELPVQYFDVQVASNNSEWGSATITGEGSYEEGEEVTITATPKSGYRFVNWTKKDGTVFSTEAVHTFTVTENLELTANFEKTGVGNESATQAGIRVYPNPNSGTFHIDLPEAALLEVFTSNGTLILREQAAAGIKTMQLESGSYLLRITSNTTTTKQIVVL